MQNRIHKITLVALAIALLFTACGPSEEDLKATSAAQTLEVVAIQETAMMDALLKLTQTAAAMPPTETSIPTRITDTPMPTLTIASVAMVPTNPPAASGGGASDLASETIPDGTRMSSNQAFTKTWKLRNTGTNTWSTGYSLVFVNGEQMTTKTEVYLSVPVPPGNLIDVSVPMTAPAKYGTYQGNWRLQDENKKQFGATIWVKIDVGDPLPTEPGPTSTAAPCPTTAPGVTFAVTAINIDINGVSLSPNPPLKCGDLVTLTVGAVINTSKPGDVKYTWDWEDSKGGSRTQGGTVSVACTSTSVWDSYQFSAQNMDVIIKLSSSSPAFTATPQKLGISCSP